MPPFPVPDSHSVMGDPDTGPLYDLLEKERRIGLVLATWDSYGVAGFEGGKLNLSKVGTAHIHKKVKKGGSSQKRYARRTENQRSEFIGRLSEHIQKLLGDFKADYIFFGGNKFIRVPLVKESVYLKGQMGILSSRTLEVGRVRQDVLPYAYELAMRSAAFIARPSDLKDKLSC